MVDLKEIMSYKRFVVVGNTLDEEKYAFKIKQRLLENNYVVYPVYKEIKNINEITNEIDVIDLCINPVKGLEILKSMKKTCKAVLIQPGAESNEIKQYLKERSIPYLEGCALVGLSLFKEK